MDHSINFTTEVPPSTVISGFTSPEYANTNSTSSSSSVSICCLNSSTTFPPTTLTNNATKSMDATSTSIDDKVAKDAFENYYEEHYTTPISILLLNFFLVAFLMIVIGIAVYPAMKRYCDSTFSFGNSHSDPNCNAYWIEDTEEASASASSSAISSFPPNLHDSSMALLNCTGGAAILASSIDDFGGSSDIELLPEIRQNDNMQ